MYTNKTFPCLVRYGAGIEDPNTALDEQEKFDRLARNGLRHLTYGTPLINSNIISWRAFKSLFLSVDDRLFIALRRETQYVFNNVYEHIVNGDFDEEAFKRAEIFITNFTAIFPFLQLSDGDEFDVPQKIAGVWQKVKYVVERIDISPQTGLLGRLIEDSDRLHAYGFIPVDASRRPLLIIKGSTYFADPGASLSWFNDFKLNNSVGEGHDLSLLTLWLQKQPKKVKLYGHSQGGTLAMILAAKTPQYISEVNALNPTALNSNTLQREKLKERWDALLCEEKPKINLFTQEYDPIMYLDNCLLSGTVIHIITAPNTTLDWLSAHAHYLTGREYVNIEKITDIKKYLEINKDFRDVVNLNKRALDFVLHPLMFLRIGMNLSLRKTNRLITGSGLPFSRAYGQVANVGSDAISQISFLTLLAVIAMILAAANSVVGFKYGTKTIIDKITPRRRAATVNDKEEDSTKIIKASMGTVPSVAKVIEKEKEKEKKTLPPSSLLFLKTPSQKQAESMEEPLNDDADKKPSFSR